MIFERFRGGFSEMPKPKKEKPGQLLQIIHKVKRSPNIYSQIVEQLAERNPEKFKSVREAQRYFDSASTNLDAAALARLVDASLGAGTFRTLSFLDEKQDRARSVSRLLQRNIENTSFERQVEKGHYLNLLETYGVSWDLEKTSRDCVQNFFDANGQTLDGVRIETEVSDGTDIVLNVSRKTARVLIESDQDYDWRELIHFGGTTKQDSETAAGGFGEGIKVAAFVLLRDQGATSVRAASRDWQIEYYFDDIAAQAYREPVKGLFVKKTKRDPKKGNYLEIIFEGDDAAEKAQAFIEVRDLFYSSENPDFQNPSFNDPAIGGFQILVPEEMGSRKKSGHLYIAGQRIHYDSRDQWDTVPDLNIWTWRKIEQRDRDRGLITRNELTTLVIPQIVEAMSIDDLKKSVYDFKPLWDHLDVFSPSEKLLEIMVNKLDNNHIKLEFEPEYLASDIPFGFQWIGDALKSKGFKLCRGFMAKIGMKSALDQFKDWQNHYRVEAGPVEARKIEFLQKAAKIIGLPEEESKSVWLFNREDENSIFAGQYNPEFYWMSSESLDQSLIDALHLYFHEAAHKAGPHGEAKFDYTLQEYIQKIQRFIVDHRDEWQQLDNEWNTIR